MTLTAAALWNFLFPALWLYARARTQHGLGPFSMQLAAQDNDVRTQEMGLFK